MRSSLIPKPHAPTTVDPSAPRDIISVGVLEDHEPETLDLASDRIQPFGHGREEIASGNAVCVVERVLDIIVGRVTFGDVSVERVDPPLRDSPMRRVLSDLIR